MASDDYDQFFNDEQQQARSLVALSADADPDQSARAQQLSDATGAPAPYIEGDMEHFERQHRIALNDQLIKQNRFLQDYALSHPMAAKVSSDDWSQLDEVSDKLHPLGEQGSALVSWLRQDHYLYDGKDVYKALHGFRQGFGDQPFGYRGADQATSIEKATGLYSRPDDVTWALSHPMMAATLGRATGLGELGVEGMARVTNGLIGLGREGVASIFGESTANVFDNAAQAAVDPATQQTLMSIGPAGAIPAGMARGAELLGDFLKAYRAATPWVRAGLEPPAGLHPLLDEAKKLQAKEDINALDEALAEAAKSATRERSPTLFADFVRSHIGDREIGIDSAAVRELYGDKVPSGDDNLLGWIPDLDQRLAGAELTGGDVRVPLADWLANVDPDVAKQLHDDIRVRDGGLTINDTKIGQDVPERITSSAIRYEGKTYLGKNHAEAYESIGKDQELPEEGIEEGYQTSTGRFVDRRAAFDIADKSKQIYDPEAVAKGEGVRGKPKEIGNEDVTLKGDFDHLGYGKKEVGPDAIQQVRGAAGFEPILAAGDRKVTLRRMDEARGKEVFGDQSLEEHEEEVHDYDMLDENGKPIGLMSVSPRRGGKDVWVHNIQAGPEDTEFYLPHFLGPGMIRDVAAQLKAIYPQMERMGGYRVTGARERANKIATAWIKLDEAPQGWSHVEPMRELLEGAWQPATARYQKRVGAFTPEQEMVSNIIQDELNRIVPNQLREVETVQQLKGKKPGDVKGFYQRSLTDWPKIVVALDEPDLAVGIARHEAIHHLRRYGFFNDAEWGTLENASKVEGWDKFIEGRYADLPEADRREEMIAEAYRHWADGQKMPHDVHTIFEKLKAFFEQIKIKFKELTGQELNWEELFRKTHEGEIGGREGNVPRMEGGQRPFMGDRMVQAAEAEPPTEGTFGLYDKGKALGVTQTHMDRMLNLIDKRNAEDLDAANKRAEVRQRRRSNKEWKARREALRDDVSNELRQRPDIAMDQLFSKQKIKLHPATLSEDQKARLPKDYIQQKNGVNADDLAPYFGYTSGDALVERLGMLTEDRRRSGMSARDYFNRLVDVETDKRLNQEFGDRDKAIHDEAMDQALSETQLNMVHEDTLAYALKAGQEPQFTKDQVRDMVKQSFDQQPVGSIKAWDFLQAAGRIGKKIEEAGAKGKWQEAYRLSQQRNHATLYAKFARDYERSRAQLDRVAKQFRKREVASVPAEYTNWIHYILQRVGYPLNRSIQDLAENIGRQTEATLADFVDAKETAWLGSRELPVADFLKDPNFRKPVDEMSHQDFMQLKSSIDVLVKAGRDEKKVLIAGEVADREAFLADARAQLETFGYKPKKAELPTIAGVRYSKWPRAFVYGLESMETFMNRLSRGDPRGLFNRFFYPLADAANGKARMQREIAKDYEALPELKDLDKLVDSPITDPLTRGTPQYGPDGSGTWEGFTRGHVIKMLLNAGNESNWKVLAHGYGADPVALFNWLQRNVTKDDIAFAEGMGKMFKKLISRYDNVQERQTGMSVEKIKLKPIQFKLADGTVVDSQGWYHPLVADPIRKTVWKQDDAGQWSQTSQGRRDMIKDQFFNFSVADGFTKKRTGAIYPLDLNFSAVPTTLNQMIHAIHFKEVIHESQKLFGDRRFAEDVAKYYGREFSKGLMPYLRAVAGAEGVPGEALANANQLSNTIRQNVISTYIGFNPFTVLKHGPTAFAMSSREVGTMNFMSAFKSMFFQSPTMMKANWDFALRNSEELQRRERHWQDTIAGQGREIEGAGNLRERIIEMGSKWVAKSDMASAGPTWLAAYNKYSGDGLSHGESATLADRAVRRAHGSTAETNQPPLVRGAGDALHPWLVSVYGFFGTAMQRRIETAHKLIDAYDLGVNEREFGSAARKLRSATGDMVSYMIIPTLIEEMVNGIGTDDHRTLASRIISGSLMGAASSVLYLRDIIHAAVSGHDPGLGLATSFLADQNKVVRDLYHGREAFNKQHAAKTVGDLMTAAGELTGVVPKAVANIARYGINVAEGQEKPKGIKDLLLGVTRGTQKERVEK